MIHLTRTQLAHTLCANLIFIQHSLDAKWAVFNINLKFYFCDK